MKLAIKFCLWSLAFIPLIVDNRVFHPYVSGKNMFIEVFVLLSLILILINFFYNKSFGDETIKKAIIYFKHPITLSVFGFFFVFIVSTIFAVDKFSAFWGNVERAEGLVGTLFFLCFFASILLMFEKKDWLCFFKLSLISTAVLLATEFYGLFIGLSRPGSLTGNSTFLAGYLIFSIGFSIIIFNQSRGKLIKYVSIIIAFLSVIGIIATETRGTFLGLASGLVVVLVYSLIKGDNIFYKKYSIRKISSVILAFAVILSLVFIFTKDSGVWKKFPVLSRLSQISLNDNTTISRLYTYETSFRAVNPFGVGLKKMLIGWGPDNFKIAYSKYYNPEQYKYEKTWFDRSHNKLLDVLVMNGILGLIMYLTIWVLFFVYIFRARNFSVVNLSILFIGSAFFVHLLFIFDQISTSLSLFFILGYLIFLTSNHERIELFEVDKYKKYIFSLFILVVLLVSLFAFFRNTLPGYIQMIKFNSLIKRLSPLVIQAELDSVFNPMTTAQTDIRLSFSRASSFNYNLKDSQMISQLSQKSISRAEDYLIDRPNDFVFIASLADVYSSMGNRQKNLDYVKKGEEYFDKMSFYAPNKPEIIYARALNFAYQNKYNESLDILNQLIVKAPDVPDTYYYKGLILWSMGESGYADSLLNFEKSFNIDNNIYIENRDLVEGVYSRFIKYYYEKRNRDSFILVVDRLKKNKYYASDNLELMVSYLNKYNRWPNVNFE